MTNQPDFETTARDGLDMMWNAHVDYSTSKDFEPRTESRYVEVKQHYLDHYLAKILAAHTADLVAKLESLRQKEFIMEDDMGYSMVIQVEDIDALIAEVKGEQNHE